MTNDEIAGVFYEMGDLLRIRGGDPFRARAFVRTGRIVESLREPAAELIKYGRLRKIRGIGEGSVGRIKAIAKTGTCLDHQKLVERLPPGLRDMLEIRGFGPAMVRTVYAHLGIGSLEQLEWAAVRGQLRGVPGISIKKEQQVLLEIKRVRAGTRRVPLARGIDEGERIVNYLRAAPGVLRCEQTGSVRRRKETIKDLDFLVVATEGLPVAQRFCELAEDESQVVLTGEGRTTLFLPSGLQADMRIVGHDNFGAGMHYFTGSKDHNIRVRLRANQRGLALSEHGVFAKKPGKRKKGVSSRIDEMRYTSAPREADIFSAVGLSYVEPELREDEGEIEAAERGTLPELIKEQHLQGECCAIPKGRPETVAAAAKARGLKYLVVNQVIRGRAPAGKTRKALDEIRTLRPGIALVAGLEVELIAHGFSISTRLLADADWVVARLPEEEPEALSEDERTRRVIAAIESKVVDVIGALTGRVLGSRDPRPIDVERVVRCAAHHGVALELWGAPARMDLSAKHARLCKELGAQVVLSSRARYPDEIGDLRYATMIARRGWLTARDVLNAGSLDAIRSFRATRLGSKKRAPARDEVKALEQQILLGRVDDELRERLLAFLKGGGDGPLQEALDRVSDVGTNPLQTAFSLLGQNQT